MEVFCGQCGKLLTVDDGFSGGYCRCTHCKAITLVPPSLDQDYDELAKVDRPANPGKRVRVAPPSTKPAGSRSGSTAATSAIRPAASPPKARAKDHLGLYLILGALILSALLLGLAAWWRFR